MPTPRNPMTYLIVGTVIGAILGAVIGIAIGTSANAGDKIATVVKTQTLRVAGTAVPATPGSTEAGTTSTTDTTSSTGTATSTVTDETTQTDTTPAFDTTPITTPTDTTTDTSDLQPNDIPPPDPYNPPVNFCTTHVCGLSFIKGVGYVVQCADGVWTMQGGRKSACRNDGGLP